MGEAEIFQVIKAYLGDRFLKMGFSIESVCSASAAVPFWPIYHFSSRGAVGVEMSPYPSERLPLEWMWPCLDTHN